MTAGNKHRRTVDGPVQIEHRDDVVELSLSQAVNVTNTSFVRSSLDRRMEEEGLDSPPVELVWFHVLVLCTRGCGRHMVDFEDHELSPGTAIWIRPGQVQRWSDVDDDFDADVVVFESASVPDLPLFERLLATTVVTELGIDADHLSRQVEWMAADLEASADEATAAAVVSVILRVIARQTRREHPELDGPHHRLTKLFVDSIEGSIHQRSVGWHARQIGASTAVISGGVCWLAGFVILWVGVANMQLTSWTIPAVALPLALVEMVTAAMLARWLLHGRRMERRTER